MKILKRLVFTVLMSPSFVHLSHAKVEYVQIQSKQNVIADVVIIKSLKNLKLFLNNDKNLPYKKFNPLKKSLPKCQSMFFAMNAGMYHPDYSPVRLYIENYTRIKKINTDSGFGNFFMQPNGVLAWNEQKAVIVSTEKFMTSDFNAKYATQSGPMLVIDGKINTRFLPNSDSLKIRNGVGIKNNELYFVISHNKVNFFDFASLFKDELGVDNALYLDGSISSRYIPQIGRHDSRFNLGPIVAFIDAKQCK